MTIAIGLLTAYNAQAILVTVDGQGEIGTDPMELTFSAPETDPLTGEQRISISGSLVCPDTLRVTVTRSPAAVTDEFCCADQCLSGDKESEQILHFAPKGKASWYVHFTPTANEETTFTYTFAQVKNGQVTESRVLTAYCYYSNEGIDNVQRDNVPCTKVIGNGVLYLKYNGAMYDIQGKKHE